MEWEQCRDIEKKYFKNVKIKDGDVVLYETVSGAWKKTTVKSTMSRKLFIEAAEVNSRMKDIVIVRVKDLERSSIIYIPTYEELAEKAGFEVPAYEEMFKRCHELIG